MSAARLFAFFSLLLFGGIFVLYLSRSPQEGESSPVQDEFFEEELEVESLTSLGEKSLEGLPSADRIEELYSLVGARLPFVETVTYSSRVPWKKGRAAWVVDYASHYDTSRHFIGRSLNGPGGYDKQDVANGDRFNVLKRDSDLRFHLVVDLSRSHMWFYAYDKEEDRRYLLKDYPVGLGREDERQVSGSLTPLGVYELGGRIAVYRPGMMGTFQNAPTEMVRVFGSRWIPFEKEVRDCTAPAKGLGIHGVPWDGEDVARSPEYDENWMGNYESDGCLRLRTEDVEELFAIIVTKPTTVEIVKDFHEAQLPGREEMR